MFENIKEVIQAFHDRDVPHLEFYGVKKHPLYFVLCPLVAIEVFIVYTVFTILAIIIDFCNLFVKR